MQRLEVSGAVRSIYGSLGVKRLIFHNCQLCRILLLYDRRITFLVGDLKRKKSHKRPACENCILRERTVKTVADSHGSV